MPVRGSAGRLQVIRERIERPGAVLQAVGLLMVARTQQAFDRQGREKAWPPRGVPNRIGILRDLQAGREPPSRRFQPRPAAIDTGRLRASIAFEASGRTVTYGSRLEYANDVQRGSTVTIAIDRTLRRALSAWLRRHREARAAMGPLFNLKELTTVVPPRPFVAFTAEDRRDVNELVRRLVLARGA